MTSSNNMQTNVPMSTFVEAGGMKTLLHSATYVTVTPVEVDPRNEENYFVDIRFRFSTKAGRPYFSQTECGIDGTVIPRKLVSKLSDEPTTTKAAAISGQDEEAESKCRANAENEGVYMPDACWIARTKALSSILEQKAREQAEEEGRVVTNVSNVRGVVCAVRANEDDAEPEMDREFCFDSPATSAIIAASGPVDEATSTPTVSADHDVSKEPTLNQVRDHEAAHFSDSFKGNKSEKLIETEQTGFVRASDADNKGAASSARILQRSGSRKRAVTRAYRSYSRENFGRDSENNGIGGSGQIRFDAAKAVDMVEKKPRDNFDDPELLLIQPNPVQPPRKLKTSVENPAGALIQPKPIRPCYNPPTKHERAGVQPKQVPHLVRATPSRGGVDHHTDRNVESDDTVARSLFRRTSDLARKVIRKLSSNDKRAARDANGEGNGDANNTDRLAKRRTWLRRGRSGDNSGRRPDMQ